MSRIQQSVAWWCFVPKHFAPEEFIRTAKQIGYTALDLVPPEMCELVARHGLGISAIGGHASIVQGLNRREEHSRIEAEIRANLALAERWHIPNLICFSGNRDGLSDEAGAEITAEGLRRVARAAEDAGVTLVLELLNSKVDHPGYQADHTGWGAQVCQQVGSPAVKLLYDIYHMQIMEGDIIRTIQANAGSIGHYHTAGNPGRNELDDRQELHYPPIFRAIRDTGYSGYISHELLPAGDPTAALQDTFALCAAHI